MRAGSPGSARYRLMERIRARQEPFGASICTSSPTRARAAPGRQASPGRRRRHSRSRPACALRARPRSRRRADADDVRRARCLVDDDGAVEPVAQHLIRRSSRPCSFFAAWYSKFSDRSPKLRAARSPRRPQRGGALQLGELGLELFLLRLRQLLDLVLGHRSSLPSVVRSANEGCIETQEAAEEQPQKTLKEKRAEKKKK